MLLPAGYAVLILAAAGVSSWRREMTLVSTTSALWLTAGFLLVEIALALRQADARSPGLVVFPLVFLAAFRFRDRWIVSRFDETRMREVLEHSMEQLRIPFERQSWGYALRMSSGRAEIRVRPLPWARAVIRIGDESRSRKIALLRTLVGKRVGRLVPRPRIRFG